MRMHTGFVSSAIATSTKQMGAIDVDCTMHGKKICHHTVRVVTIHYGKWYDKSFLWWPNKTFQPHKIFLWRSAAPGKFWRVKIFGVPHENSDLKKKFRGRLFSGKNLGTQENFGGGQSLKFVEGEKMPSYIQSWFDYQSKCLWISGRVWPCGVIAWPCGCRFELSKWDYFFVIDSGHSARKYWKTLPVPVFFESPCCAEESGSTYFSSKCSLKTFIVHPTKRTPQIGHFFWGTREKKSLG